MKKSIFPVPESGAIVQFLLSILQVIPQISKVKLTSSKSVVTYVSMIFDQKALSPGAECYGNKLYGVMPPITVEEATALCSEGYSDMHHKLIDDFRMRRRKWVKQAEVFLLQLLDLYVAIPFAVQYLETSGDSSAVRKRVNEVLLCLNSCYTCLKSSIDTGEPPLCQYMCIDCFRNKRICENHDGLFDTWNPDGRPCVGCAEKSFNGEELECIRLHAIISCSDMDPTYICSLWERHFCTIRST